MDNTKYIALSRQMALWKKMDVVSNNMANMNTAGYKQGDAVFSTFVAETQNAQGFGKVPVYFTQDLGQYNDFAGGAIVETGNTFDLALHGDGFFSIETPNGEMYTKKGQFTLDANGQLVTNEGHPVLSENNEPFYFAPGETDISITESGEVTTENGIVGRLKIANFADNQELLKVAGSLWKNKDGNEMQIGPDNSKILQGSIEKSNVEPMMEMTKMLKLQRSYEFVQQMINQEHERVSNTISAYASLA